MAVLTATSAKGQPYFEGTQTLYLTHDNASDKFVGGVYSHNAMEASATEYDAFMSCVLWMIQVMKNGGGSFQVYNNTGGTIFGGIAVTLTGHQGVDANGQPIFTITKSDYVDASFLPASAILLSSLANNTQGTAYLAGTFQPTIAPLDATAVQTTIGCNTTNTSVTVTLASVLAYGQQNLGTEILEVGMKVTGTGIPVGATIASIVDRNTFTLSAAATATNANVTLSFFAAVGTSVFLSSSGTFQLIRPSNTNQIVQVCGRLQTATATSTVDGFISPPIRYAGVNLQDESVLLYKLEKRARQNWNYLINGDFNFFQRLPTPTTLTAPAAYGGYVADRFYLTGESLTNDQQAAQVDESATSGFSSFYSCNVKNNNAGTKRIAINQVIESYNAIPLRGRQVCFQFKFNPSTTRNVRAAIISAQSSSTKDTFTAAQRDVVNTWASGTYTTGNFFKATSGVWTYTVVAVSGSLSGTAATWSGVQTVQGTVPNDCQNLILIVWDDAGAATGASFKVTQMGLFDGPAQRDWLPRPISQERELCRAYCRLDGGSRGGYWVTGTLADIEFAFSPVMRATPAAAVFSGATIIIDSVAIVARTATTPSLSLVFSSPRSCTLRISAAAWSGAAPAAAATALSEGDYFIFDAEL